MYAYIIRRLVSIAIVFFLVTILVFILVQLPPGDYIDYYISRVAAGGDSVDIDQISNQLRSYYGLDQPIVIRYFNWLGDMLTGDFGYSLQHNIPVIQLIQKEIGWTLLVTVLSLLFSWVIGIPLGIYSAVRQYSFSDHVVTFLGFLGLSIPSFFLALLILFLLVSAGTGITGGLFSEEYVSAAWSFAKFVDLLKHLWIPVVAIGAAQIATIIRIMRSNLLDILEQQFVTTARSKGLREWVVIIKHAVRVAINPLISLAGMQAPRLISGIVITAIVLDLPIMGPTYVTALRSQDVLLATAYLLIISAFLLFGNLIADIVLAWVDPRIKYD